MANPVKQLQRKSEEYQRLDKADRRRFWSDGILNNALYILMVIFIVYTAIKNKNFLSAGSIANIVSLVAASLPMALGIAGCIVLTGTDLSGGRVVGLTAAVAGALLQDRTISRKLFSNLPAITPGWILLTVLIVVAIGALIGMVNGFFVAKFSLHPFIVTLATQLITYGLILIFFMLNGNNGQPVSGLSQEYKSVVSAPMIQFTTGSGAKISIPWYVLYAVIFVALMWFIWNKTAFGKNMFAVGSNADAAKVSGVNVFWTTVMVTPSPVRCTALRASLRAPASAPSPSRRALTTSATPSQPASSAVFPSSAAPARSAALCWACSCCVSSSLHCPCWASTPPCSTSSRAALFWRPARWICGNILPRSKTCITIAADEGHLPLLWRKEAV